MEAVGKDDLKLTVMAATDRVSTLDRFDRVLAPEEIRLISDDPDRASAADLLHPPRRAAPNLGKYRRSTARL